MGWNIAMQAAGIIAGALILHFSLEAIDGMHKDTQHAIRVAFILLAAGGFAQIIDPWLPDDVGSGADLLVTCGLALLLVADRRCSMCPRAQAVRDGKRRHDLPHDNGGVTT